MIATSGTVRAQVSKLVDLDPDWDSMHSIMANALSLLDERNALVHSVVVHATDEDHDLREVMLWHARTGTARSLPTVEVLRRLAWNLSRCSVAAAMWHHQAEERYEQLGAENAPKPPKPLAYGLETA
jgi:hypothetical protein